MAVTIYTLSNGLGYPKVIILTFTIRHEPDQTAIYVTLLRKAAQQLRYLTKQEEP
jgi:hypothetical protein